VVASALTPLLTFELALAMAGPGVALGAGLIVACDPPSVTHALLLLSDALFALLLIASLAALKRAADSGGPGWAALAGLGLSASSIVRPIGIYLVPIAAVWLVVRRTRRSWSGAALVLALGFALPVGWMARNARLGLGFTLSQIGPHHLLLFLASPTLADAQGIEWSAADDLLRASLPVSPSLADLNALSLRVLREHPVSFAKVYVTGLARMWGGPGLADLDILTGNARPVIRDPVPPVPPSVPAWTLRPVAWGLWFVLVAGIPYGAWSMWKDGRRHDAALLLAVLGYFTAASASPGAYARLRVPVTPCAAIFSALGWSRLRR
jgi:4-amino-4-deoxy-L-arabinose transferase-like glycosyltransferase